MDKEIIVKGTGIPNLITRLVKRTDKVAMYKRTDGYYEVGIIKVNPAANLFGRDYPERETYWSNEDFGTIAKTTKNLRIANTYYNSYVKQTNE